MNSSSHENMMVALSRYPQAISITRRDEISPPFRGGKREVLIFTNKQEGKWNALKS